jgi:transposase
MVLWSLNLETASLIGRPLKRFVKSLKTKNIQAAIEATCTWYHIYETLDALGVETTLVNMRRTKTTDCTQLFIFTLVKK